MNKVLSWLLSAVILLTGSMAMAEESVSRTAVFAGGCFWCMQGEFDSEKGVLGTKVGYAGGHTEKPTYEQVGTGTTGHREVIEVTYDPKVVAYERLLDIFWGNIDPLDAAGQFCDKGEQYKAGIFVNNERERQAAEKSAVTLGKKLGQKVVTDIVSGAKFWPAEDYHQDYYRKNAFNYQLYRAGCGRDERLRVIKDKMAK